MISLVNIKKIHFTGIKGVGLSALSCIAKDLGKQVSGSDTEEVFVTDEILNKKNITDISDFSSGKIKQVKPDLLIYTAAHGGEENEEVEMAKSLGIPTLSFAQALGLFSQDKFTISISGVGGKTTTTAMLATILEKANLHPSYMVGVGNINSLDFPGKYDSNGQHFITEADEYKSSVTDFNPKFHYLNPKVIIIPSLSFDHPDVYKNENHTLETFRKYIEKLPQDGCLVINLDGQLSLKLLDILQTKATIYAFTQDKNLEVKKPNIKLFHVSDVNYKNSGIEFNLAGSNYNLSCLGQFNITNAVSAILSCKFIGLDYSSIQNGLCTYKGVGRRFEKVFSKGSTYIFDDYAHHPSEIKTTLRSFRLHYPGYKLIAIFQPHTYSRTKALFSEFADSFVDADQVIMYPIFSSAREKIDNSVSSELLSQEINKNSHNSLYLDNYDKIIDFLKTQNLEKTIILTMGAGDIYKINDRIKIFL